MASKNDSDKDIIPMGKAITIIIAVIGSVVVLVGGGLLFVNLILNNDISTIESNNIVSTVESNDDVYAVDNNSEQEQDTYKETIMSENAIPYVERYNKSLSVDYRASLNYDAYQYMKINKSLTKKEIDTSNIPQYEYIWDNNMISCTMLIGENTPQTNNDSDIIWIDIRGKLKSSDGVSYLLAVITGAIAIMSTDASDSTLLLDTKLKVILDNVNKGSNTTSVSDFGFNYIVDNDEFIFVAMIDVPISVDTSISVSPTPVPTFQFPQSNFTVTEYYDDGDLLCRIRVESLIVTNIEVQNDDSYEVTYEIEGILLNSYKSKSYLLLYLDCYDKDGNIIDTGLIWTDDIIRGGRYKQRNYISIPSDAVRFEFRGYDGGQIEY